MKTRVILLILTFCMLLSCVACVGERNNGGAVQTTTTGNIDEPEAAVSAWTAHGYEKTIVNASIEDVEFSTDYTVYLAKGETEGCQLIVRSDKEIKGTTLTMASGNTETIKTSAYSMNRTHSIGRKQYTDALIPYYGRKLNLEARVALPFMVEFTTDKNTPAGDHKYVYEFKDKEGNILASFNITVHVWNILLPEDKTFATAMELRQGFINNFGGVTADSYKNWYDIQLEHNICSYTLPYDILDERADAYMSDPRVTSFRVPHFSNNIDEIDEEKLLEIYNKLKSNPVWLEKAYFYPVDEPRNLEMLENLKAWEEKLTSLCPEIEIIAPYYTNIQIGADRDQTDYMAEFTDLWCPKLCFWDDEKSYGEFLGYTPAKSFADRMAELKASGERIWSYVANDPDDPYAQMFLDTEGVNQRLMLWQCYQRDIEGFLYWGTNYYGFSDADKTIMIDPWESVNTRITNGDGEVIYGCGFLFYPGMVVGVPNCVPSIRAKIFRDGVDDIELFYLAEELLGKDWLMSKTYEATPSLTEFTDNDTFAALRIEIGNALEAALEN